MNIEERMDYLEFRMDLLRDGSELCKFIYDSRINREQLNGLYNIMDYCREKIGKNEEISSADYETKVLELVDNKSLDYHFCETFARLLWEEKRYEEDLPFLYKNSQKFYNLFK